MFSTPFYKKAAAVFLGLSLASTPVLADDLDVLGQFLQQNLTSDQDPLGTFLAENPDDMLEAQAAIAGPLLSSQAALIVNNRTGEVLYQLNMNDVIPCTEAEIDRLKGTGSRLSVGTQLTRAQLLHLSLMSSENRATHALGRTYPGGMSAFVAAMNAKAQSLGMTNSRFYEPTGLDYRNVSTAWDLNKLAAAASNYAPITKNSTSTYGSVYTSAGRQQDYKNTNALVREGTWDIELQKTGYIRESGRSMVVRARIGREPVTIVLLNSPTSTTRVNDARKIQSWMMQRPS